MKAHTCLLVPRSRSSAEVKVIYKVTFIKNGCYRGISVSQTHRFVMYLYQRTKVDCYMLKAVILYLQTPGFYDAGEEFWRHKDKRRKMF